MSEKFVHLHIHSDMSKLDGHATIAEYASVAAKRGNPALSVTDHGTMRGIYTLAEECKKNDIKPIYGVEFYVCDDMNRKGLTEKEKREAIGTNSTKKEQKEIIKQLEEKLRIRSTTHLTAWALNDVGLKNLYKLSSKAWIDGFYYKPRIDIDTLLEYENGIIIGTGCVGSAVYFPWINKRVREADTTLGKLSETFGDRLYLEIQPHDLKENYQQKANQFAITIRELSNKHKLLATQDSHYLRPEDAAYHDALLAIRSNKKLSDPDRLKFDGNSYWFKTKKEMRETFDKYHSYISKEYLNEAFNSTVELAERCTAKIEIDPFKCLLPPVDIPNKYKSEYSYLCSLVAEGLRNRKIEKKAKIIAEAENISINKAMSRYTEQCKREIKVFKKNGFINYFLVLHDLYRWVIKNGIPRGPGRGSAAGSIVAYLLNITDIDPIEHKLMFERFIAPGRINMPDIDADFSDLRRQEIIDYLVSKYGDGRVAQIATMAKMNSKQAFRDISKVMEVPYAIANKACGEIPDSKVGALDEAFDNSDDFKSFCKEYPDVLEYSKGIEGTTKYIGKHAAAVVTSPIDLTEVLPLEVSRIDGDPVLVTAYDMRGVEGVGLLKIDILGLKTIEVLDDMRKLVIERTGENFELVDIPINDQKTLDGFTERDFVGIFQFDSNSAKHVSKGMKYLEFDDIVVMNAINRPGAVDFADEFKERRLSDKPLKVMYHKKVSDITSNALGLMVYQEHIIKICTDVAGFSPSEADKMRKKIGKSEGVEALEEVRDVFVDGCVKKTKNMSREKANELFDAIAKFGRYGFNRSHAVCYSMIGYWTMWFKQHHPIEFYCATLRRTSETQKINVIVRDAEEHGVKTLLPDVNLSDYKFVVDYEKNALRGSLIEINGVGKNAVNTIINSRKKDGKFNNIADFLKRTSGRSVTSKTIEVLAKGGALDNLVPNPRWLINNIKTKVIEIAKKEDWDLLLKSVSESERNAQYDIEKRLQVAAEVNPLAMPPHPLISWRSWVDRNIRIIFEESSETLFYEDKTVYIAGKLVEMSEGISGSGEKFMSLRIEMIDEKFVRVRIGSEIYNEASVINKKGQILLICGKTNSEWNNINASFFADLEILAKKVDKRKYSELTLFENLFVRHPSIDYNFATKDYRRLAKKDLFQLVDKVECTVRVIGVVTHVREYVDKRGRDMGFFGIAGISSYIDVVCFGSSWYEFSDDVKPGVLAYFKLVKLEDCGFSLDIKRSEMHIFDERI